jgi:hypothetical protein
LVGNKNQYLMRSFSSAMEKLTREKPSKDALKKALDQKSVDLAEASQTSDFIKRIQVGQRVCLRGLSYSELNDAKGVVIDSERGVRVTVKLTHASSKMLQQHSDGLSVKWENIEWMDKRPIGSLTVHCTMNADDETGRTLTPAESQEKLRNLQKALVRTKKEPVSIIHICMEDDKTNTDHMNQSDAREFLQQHIAKLRNAYRLFFGKNKLFLKMQLQRLLQNNYDPKIELRISF